MNERTNTLQIFIKKLGFRGLYTEMTLSTRAHSILLLTGRRKEDNFFLPLDGMISVR